MTVVAVMKKGKIIQLITLVFAPLILVAVLSGCSPESGQQESSVSSQAKSFRDSNTGLEATIPAGWSHVRTHNLPGAQIPLQVASFETARQVTGICQPGKIKEEIPTGGALVQILSQGWKSARRTAWSRLDKPVSLGSPRSYECGSAYNLFFKIRGRAFQGRVWTSPIGLSDRVKSQTEALLTSLRRPDGPAHAVDNPDRLEIDPSKVPFGRRQPFIALDCPIANSYRCDRIYFALTLTRPAVWLNAWVGGRKIQTKISRTAPGSAHYGERGYGWFGTLQPAGMNTSGSPLEIGSAKGPDYWAGRPPVKVDIKLQAGFSGGRVVTEYFRNVKLAAGHG